MYSQFFIVCTTTLSFQLIGVGVLITYCNISHATPIATQQNTAQTETDQAVAARSSIDQPHSVLQQDRPTGEYVFDSTLFRGSALNKKTFLHLSQHKTTVPGRYPVDLYINNRFFEHTNIDFVQDTQQLIQPCFSTTQLQRADIILLNVAHNNDPDRCYRLEELIGTGSSQFDFNHLKLNLSIPNSLQKQVPMGYVNPKDWNAGDSIGFINYISHFNYNRYTTNSFSMHQDSAYLALNTGVNLGLWQYRQLSNLRYQKHQFASSTLHRYIKRPIAALESELSLGQLNSSGRFFSGLNFKGISLYSDERMLPNSRRGYAPVIQGIAKSNARVSVQQNGREIYQISVAPGPFKISDLFPTNASGDLKVIVEEADGSSSAFQVPFSAVAESVRLGAFKYHFDLGQTQNITDARLFSNLSTQYGLSNSITINSGLRLAKHYQAAVLGSAYTHKIGAFGANLTLTHSALAQQHYQTGWMFSTQYSKTIQSTQSMLSLSAYRISNHGYRELAEFIAQDAQYPMSFTPSAFNQAISRMTLSLNQYLANFGSVYFSASTQHYSMQKSNDSQFQLGYSKSFTNGVSMNLSASRQKSRSSPNQSARDQNQPGLAPSHDQSLDTSTRYTLSLSLPLGRKTQQKPHSLMLSAYHSAQQNTYQSNLHGAIAAGTDLNYNLGMNYDDASQQQNWNLGLQKHTAHADMNVNAAMGQHYWQTAANLQGAFAIHAGGITFGRYLSDTFALIEAPGAQGAKVFNSQDSRINRSGYALLPALTPYQYNSVILSPEGMSNQVELASAQQRVSPYAGAAIKIKFKVHTGFALLIRSTLTNGDPIPIGAEVFDQTPPSQTNRPQDQALQASVPVGIVAQNGQIYLRSEQMTGKLSIKWGESTTERCDITYSLTQQQLQTALIQILAPCQMEP